MRPLASTLSWIAAWTWTFLSVGGGLWLLFTEGPWPPTNGWFAVLSGLSICPLLPSVLKKFFGISLSGWIQFGAAVSIFIAGHAALTICPHRY